MARHRRYRVEFKRRVAQEHLADGVTLVALARHHDISRNLIRLWVENYEAGEFDDDDVQADLLAHCQRRIAELERTVGQLVMENEWLKKNEACSGPAQRREQLRGERPDGLSVRLSVRRGCELMNLARSMYYYRPRRRAKDEDALKRRIEAICAAFPRYGYRRVTAQLQHEVGTSTTSGWRGSCVRPI